MLCLSLARPFLGEWSILFLSLRGQRHQHHGKTSDPSGPGQ